MMFSKIKIRTERNGFQMVGFQPSVRGRCRELETLPDLEVGGLVCERERKKGSFPEPPLRVGQNHSGSLHPSPPWSGVKDPNSPAG